MMFDRGYLASGQMAGAFQLLRSNDLLWSRGVRDYLMGERTPMNDLMAWNQDATRMPYRMHAEYLNQLFLGNDLAAGRFRVHGRPVALNDVKLPIFCLGTETDHVAPWRSVFKLHLLTDAQVSFVLASGGHNAGVVSPPGHPGRHHRVLTRAHHGKYLDADAFLARAELRDGSWWTTWTAWLAAQGGRQTVPPPMGRAQAGYPVLCDAPGAYVHIR
jgi:polyhydroxyalkanoate synthase